MRQFIRHPSDIPIHYDLEDVVAHRKDYLYNVSHGGLSFRSGVYIKQGSVINISIPIREPVFQAEGIVVWCRKNGDQYDIGVEFRETDVEYRVRMVEQVCYIEEYKQEVLKKEGRKLTGEQAATEWITKYAKDFPRE
ncbi:PilZ domain-containing protein [bacterium]|nr:PilZ domain-containing protein [bacterium]